MSEDGASKSDPKVKTIENMPWWVRVPLGILDKHGVTTVIALLALWAGWAIVKTLGDRHFRFIDASLTQQELTTSAVEAIKDNTAINSDLLRQLNTNIMKEHQIRSMEHQRIMDEIERLRK